MAESNTKNPFNWSSFCVGAICGSVVSLFGGMMLVFVVMYCITSIGTSAGTTFTEVAATLEADADRSNYEAFADFEAYADVDTAVDPID